MSKNDFVFIGSDDQPYRVRHGWLLSWHADGHWTSKSRMASDDIERLFPNALPENQAELYEAGIPFLKPDDN